MEFSTANCSATDKNRIWAQTLSETYFPLSAECHNVAEFEGTLSSWSLGILGLSRDGMRRRTVPSQDGLTLPMKKTAAC